MAKPDKAKENCENNLILCQLSVIIRLAKWLTYVDGITAIEWQVMAATYVAMCSKGFLKISYSYTISNYWYQENVSNWPQFAPYMARCFLNTHRVA